MLQRSSEEEDLDGFFCCISLCSCHRGGGLLGAIVALVVAAAIILVAARLIPGFEVAGFGGAVIAVISIALVTWIVEFLVDAIT